MIELSPPSLQFPSANSYITPRTSRAWEGTRKFGTSGRIYFAAKFTDDIVTCDALDANHNVRICQTPTPSRPYHFVVYSCGTPPPAGVWTTDYGHSNQTNPKNWTMGDGNYFSIHQLYNALAASSPPPQMTIRNGALWCSALPLEFTTNFTYPHFSDSLP